MLEQTEGHSEEDSQSGPFLSQPYQRVSATLSVGGASVGGTAAGLNNPSVSPTAGAPTPVTIFHTMLSASNNGRMPHPHAHPFQQQQHLDARSSAGSPRGEWAGGAFARLSEPQQQRHSHTLDSQPSNARTPTPAATYPQHDSCDSALLSLLCRPAAHATVTTRQGRCSGTHFSHSHSQSSAQLRDYTVSGGQHTPTRDDSTGKFPLAHLFQRSDNWASSYGSRAAAGAGASASGVAQLPWGQPSTSGKTGRGAMFITACSAASTCVFHMHMHAL